MSLVQIDFFADFVCPWCYVGWEALKRAAEARPALRVSVAWRNFLLRPDMPAEGMDRRAYLEANFEPERIAETQRILNAAAEAAGVPLNLNAATRFPNTIDAHRLVSWAARAHRAEAAIDAIFAAYFVDGRDIGEAAVLLDAAQEAGLDRAAIAALLASEEDRADILRLHEAAMQSGVTGVPVAILNRKAVVMGAESPAVYGEALEAAA